MRAVVLSDTHVPDFAKALPPALLPHLRRADLILHAGDITSAALLGELSGYAPVHAALGNCDGPDAVAWGAAREVRLELERLEVGVLHDSGPRDGRVGRLRRRFPGGRLIVFGHSHIPVDVEVRGVRFLNPGSPTWKRRQPFPTFATVSASSRGIRTRIIELP